MKKFVKFLCIALSIISATFFISCDLTEGDKDKDNSAPSGGFIPEQNLNVTVNFDVTDPLLYEQYQAQSLPEVIERVSPSVVGVSIATDNSTAYGSGIVIADSEEEELTFIATSHSLISGATTVTVTDFSTGAEYSASPVGTDPQTDICVIKISALLQKCTLFEDSSLIKAGEGIISVANSMGTQKNTVCAGIISANDFTVNMGEGNTSSIMLANVSWNNGSIGGGIFTQSGGFLAGMICSGTLTSLPAYVVPSDTLKEVCSEIIKSGYVEGRYKLGITVVDNKSGWGITESVSIVQLSLDGCMYADGAGLKEGDIIESFIYDGTTYQINKTEDLYGYLYGLDFTIGDQVVFNVERTGTKTQILITIKQYNYFDYQ